MRQVMQKFTSNVLWVSWMMMMIAINVAGGGGVVAIRVPLLTGCAHVDNDRGITGSCVFVVATVDVSFWVRIRTKTGTRGLRD
jgi:hypothetical protein